MRYLVLLLLIVQIGCIGKKERTPIIIPEVSEGYYLEAARNLSKDLDADTLKEDILKQQLSYYEKSGWPLEAAKPIRLGKKLLFADPVFQKQCVAYHKTHDQHLSIIEYAQELSKYNQLPVWLQQELIDALISLGYKKSVSTNLDEYLHVNQSPEDFLFAGERFLQIGDTLLSVFYFEKARKSITIHPSYVQHHIPMLLGNDLPDKALEVALDHQSEKYMVTSESKLMLAEIYARLGNSEMVRSTLLNQPDDKMLLTLSDWYYRSAQWDSAHAALDRILVTNPRNLNALYRKGSIDEERGWLTRSLGSYNQILEIDSTQLEARERIREVQGKIAYLRKIQELKREIPVLDLTPKKSNE